GYTIYVDKEKIVELYGSDVYLREILAEYRSEIMTDEIKIIPGYVYRNEVGNIGNDNILLSTTRGYYPQDYIDKTYYVYDKELMSTVGLFNAQDELIKLFGFKKALLESEFPNNVEFAPNL